jgi:hypothetical protein
MAKSGNLFWLKAILEVSESDLDPVFTGDSRQKYPLGNKRIPVAQLIGNKGFKKDRQIVFIFYKPPVFSSLVNHSKPDPP